MRRVVVTGMGAVNSIGDSLPDVWRNLISGANGVSKIDSFDTVQYSCKVAAQVKTVPADVPLSSFPLDRCRRMVQLFLRAVREAYGDSGLADAGLAPTEIGVAAGTSVNYFQVSLLRYLYGFRKEGTTSIDMQRLAREGRQPANSFALRSGDLTAAVPAKCLGLAGPNLSVDTACAAGLHSIGEAFRLVKHGRATAMIAGGSSAHVKPLGILAFDLLGALSRNPDPACASRPFDRSRDGFVMGEGAGAIVLESLEHARKRGARIYGEIVGFGSSMNAHNLTDPSPEGICEARAIQWALEEAQMSSDSVDYVAAHGTSTPKNDETETSAIKRVFGDHARRLMISSNKGQIGHTIAAAGAFNMIFALKAIDEGCVPPTMHYEVPDPACDLDYVPNECRSAKIGGALINAFAFAGQNAVIAVRRMPD